MATSLSVALAAERVRVDELQERLVVTFRHLTVREIDIRKYLPCGHPFIFPEI